MKYLLDSVVLIDHLNGRKPAAQFLAENGEQCMISAITRAEVLTGADGQTRRLVSRLLDRFATLPIDIAVADLGARLRRRHRWKLPDALQAAVAKLAGLVLVTRDAKAFGGEPGLRVLRIER